MQKPCDCMLLYSQETEGINLANDSIKFMTISTLLVFGLAGPQQDLRVCFQKQQPEKNKDQSIG